MEAEIAQTVTQLHHVMIFAKIAAERTLDPKNQKWLRAAGVHLREVLTKAEVVLKSIEGQTTLNQLPPLAQ